MEHPVPSRPELGAHNGLAYALFMPQDVAPTAGVVVLHGAGSAKESHFDYARRAVAMGMAAIAFDARGHGRSEGALGAGAVDDVLGICGVLREHVQRIALRGSSLGGFYAVMAGAAAEPGLGVGAVVAICPAPADLLLRGLRSGRLTEFRSDRESLDPWLEGADLTTAAASLSPDTALLLLHAQGDEQVPYAVSEELHAAAGEPKRLLLLPGGHHRSIQHDAELQAETLRFVARSLAR